MLVFKEVRAKTSSSLRLSVFPLLSSTLPGSSASEVTTLWRYTNVIIIIVIIRDDCVLWFRLLTLPA